MSPIRKERTRPLLRRKAFRAPADERGFVLVIVLLVIAFLFPLVLAFNSKVQLNLIQAENFRNSVQALRIARSGVQGAMGMLKMDDATYDSPKDLWSTSFPSLAFGEGAIQGALSVTVVDEDGKIPINLLLKQSTATQDQGDKGITGQTDDKAGKKAEPGKTEGQKTTGSTPTDPIDRELEARLRALITRLGGNPDIVEGLIDWIDADDDVTGKEGAENEYYKEHGTQCKNGPLDTLDELLMIKGFDKELVVERRLKDYLTVAPRTDTKINVNTAPLDVLQSVLGTKSTGFPQPLNESDIDDLHRYREEHELKTNNEIGLAIKISQDQLGRINPLVKVNSSYFTITSRYTINKVVKAVEAVVKRDGQTVTITSWREF